MSFLQEAPSSRPPYGAKLARSRFLFATAATATRAPAEEALDSAAAARSDAKAARTSLASGVMKSGVQESIGNSSRTNSPPGETNGLEEQGSIRRTATPHQRAPASELHRVSIVRLTFSMKGPLGGSASAGTIYASVVQRTAAQRVALPRATTEAWVAHGHRRRRRRSSDHRPRTERGL